MSAINQRQCLSLLFLLCVLLGFCSCDSNLGVNIYDKEQLATLPAKINKYVKPDMQVTELTFMPTSAKHFTDIMESVSITYVDPANPQRLKEMKIDLAGDKMEDSKEVFLNRSEFLLKKELEKAASIKNLDYIVIYTNLEKAARQVSAQELDNAGTHSYSIGMDKDPALVKHHMVLNGKPKKGATSLQGRRLVTNYYELPFTADAKGNVTMDEN